LIEYRCIVEVRLGVGGLVGQVADEVGLPVLPHALVEEPVERGVEGGVGHGADVLGLDLGGVAERLDRLLAQLRPAAPARDQDAEHVAVALLRDERQRRGHLPSEEHTELLGRLLDVVVVGAHHRRCVLDLVQQGAAVDGRDVVQGELHRRDHTEVPAPAPQRPEQVLVLVLARDEDPAVGGDHLRAEEVVARQPAAAGEVADAPAERQPAHARGRDDASGRGEAVGVRGVVEVPPRGAAPGARGLPDAVHEHVVDQ
jgi:hypothetical protein